MKLNNLDDFTKTNWYTTTQNEQQQSSDTSVVVTNLKRSIQSDASILNSSAEQQNTEIINLDIEDDELTNPREIYINPSIQYPNKRPVMPSKEMLTATASSMQQQQQQQPTTAHHHHLPPDVLAVEELVHEIKENLRLKARPHGRTSRPSPYHIPCRSWNDHQSNNISSLSTSSLCSNSNSSNLSSCSSQENHLNCSTTASNMMKHHLQQRYCSKKEQDIDDPYELLQALLKSKNLVKEAVRRLQLNSISPKQRSYFYESDDDSRSPMFRVCQLEL